MTWTETVRKAGASEISSAVLRFILVSHSTVLARPVCLFVRVSAASFPCRFPDERTPIEATPLSATSTELGLGWGLGLGLDSLSHSSSHVSPSSRHPPFTHYPFPPRSLLQTLMKAWTPGRNKVLNKKLAFSLPFFTVTMWPPSKFSSTMTAKVSGIPMQVTLSPKLPTSTCLTLTAVTLAVTQTVTDVLHGSVHRLLYLEGCAKGGLSLSLFSLFFSSSLFLHWDQHLFATRWSSPFIRRL